MFDLAVTKTEITLTAYNADGTTRNYQDRIYTTNIKRLTCDGRNIYINKKDFQSEGMELQVARDQIATYSYLGTAISVPSIWTIMDNIDTQVKLEAEAP